MKKIVVNAIDKNGNMKEFIYDFRYERFITKNQQTPKQIALNAITSALVKKVKEKLFTFLKKNNLTVIDCEVITQKFTQFNCVDSHLFYKII